MRRSALGAVVAVIGLTVAGAASDRYVIDKAHSRIGFAVRHMMVSTTRGEFQEFEGDWRVDVNNIPNSSVRMVIQTASIDTSNEKRDDHLRTGDFLDTTRYPTITFQSTAVKKKGKRFELAGDLTIKDVTKRVVIPFTMSGPVKTPYGTTLIGVEGGLTINRQDYNVKWNTVLDTGGVAVGDEVTIDLALEGILAN